MSRHPALRRLFGAVLSATFAVMYLAGTASAASVTFGTGSGQSKFGSNITFTQPYTGSIKSASLLLEIPYDSAGPEVIPVSISGSGALVSTVDTTSGFLFPFAPVVANFEVTLADGTVQDGPDIHLTYADDRFTWKMLTGKVVTVHYLQASATFAQNLLTLADGGVTKASAMYGVTETQPIEYYVYPSQSVFQQGLNQPDTVGGVAEPEYRIAFSVVADGDNAYAAQVMPHEVTHVVFWDAAHNPYHGTPRWLDEGFAQYISEGYDTSSLQQVTKAVKAGTLTSLMALTDYFPMDATRIYLAYAEAVSAVDFMVRKYGQPAILKLVQAYASGGTDDEAFTAGLGVDVKGFDTAWETELGVTPTKYGPQPAPTGPLPTGWSTSGGAGASIGPDASGGTSASSSSAPSQSSGGHSGNTAVMVLAAILAVAGAVMVGIAMVLIISVRR
ncbi:MAG TPA: peptidase MA family metallohydrolase [Candidatus Limnocylindrales bacterium]